MWRPPGNGGIPVGSSDCFGQGPGIATLRAMILVQWYSFHSRPRGPKENHFDVAVDRPLRLTSCYQASYASRLHKSFRVLGLPGVADDFRLLQ